MESYSHIYLLLQRDVLAPCSGEAKACYNTIQALSKIVLSEAWLTKSLCNEFEGLFIAKGGVTLHIPLCDSSTTLMTLHLLYDCYIQLLTLDLHLTWPYITMHMYSCETTWLEKAMEDITNTQSIVMRTTLWHACDGEGGELMPRLVIHDSVHAPHGDILLKRTLTFIAMSALIWLLHLTHLLACTWSY